MSEHDGSSCVGWAKPRKRHSRPKDGVASLAYAHVFAPSKKAWARRHSASMTRVNALVAPWPTLRFDASGLHRGRRHDFGMPLKHNSRMQGAVATDMLLLMQACGFDQSGDFPRMIKCSGSTGHH